MDYEKAFDYIINHNITAYELAKYSGKSVSGFRKLINGEAVNPRRETKELIVNFVNKVTQSNSIEPLKGSIEFLKSGPINGFPYYPEVLVTNSDVQLYEQIISNTADKKMMYDPNLEGSDFVLPNFGESNYPAIRSGDLVGYKKIVVNSFDSLNLDRIYMIVTVNSQRMNKKLQYCKDDNNKLWAISVNSDKYKPFKILKTDITELFEIVGVSRRFGL